MENKQLMIDTRDIELTASVHQVTKFRIFELAYAEWHGAPASEADIEAYFIAYLFDGEVPCWVRAYTRKTLRLCQEAGLELPAMQDERPGMVLALNAETLMTLAALVMMSLAYVPKLF